MGPRFWSSSISSKLGLWKCLKYSYSIFKPVLVLTFAGSSPYTFTVLDSLCGDGYIISTEACDDGNTTSGDGCSSSCAIESGWACNGQPSVCQTCGNKIREGTEVCDDGNVMNGDGCSSICVIEDNGVCISESSKLRYDCMLCYVSWTPNSSHTLCLPNEINSAIAPFSSFYITILSIGIALNFILTKFFKYPSYGIFIMFTHFQMFMLIPLIGAYIPSLVIDFYRYMYGMLFNFWFIFDWSVFINYGKTFGKYSYGYNWYLYLINLQSYSALSNMGKLIWIFMWLIVVFLILSVLWLILKKAARETCAFKLTNYLLMFEKNTMFIRLFILSFCFMWLACMTEIGIADTPNNQPNSYSFAFITLICLIVFMILSGLICLLSTNQKWNRVLSFTHELFNGTKENWKYRTFPVVSMLRTALLVVFVCSTYYKSMYLTLSLMVGVQSIYLGYILILRPHLCFKDLGVEIVNEIAFSLELIFLYLFDRESRWSGVISWIYISVILGCITIYLAFGFGALGYQLWKLDKRKRERMAIKDDTEKKPEEDEV